MTAAFVGYTLITVWVYDRNGETKCRAKRNKDCLRTEYAKGDVWYVSVTRLERLSHHTVPGAATEAMTDRYPDIERKRLSPDFERQTEQSPERL